MAFTPHMEKEKIKRTVDDLSGLIRVSSRPLTEIEYAPGECPSPADAALFQARLMEALRAKGLC